MNAYFDNEIRSNCHGVPFVFDQRFDHQLRHADFDISFDRNYNQGIYIVSVKEYSPNWCGPTELGSQRHILYEIPQDVITAAQRGKIIIVIDSQAEGLPLTYQGVDGFLLTHAAMRNLSLPAFSVLIFDSNQKFDVLYHQWCIENMCKPIIAHVPAFTHVFYFNRRPSYSLINDAIATVESKDFSSLNRNMRQHRIDHLLKLITEGIVHKGLVSGYYSNDPDNPNQPTPTQIYTKIPDRLHTELLKQYLPLTIDDSYQRYSESPDIDPDKIFNHWIYKNSLLSFVTETAFHYPGAFITEKTIKPIAAGHPFIVLGQYRILDTLRNMGYRTDFAGIDQSYDNIEDPLERFTAAHRSLTAWVKLDRDKKIKYIQESMPIIDYNRELFNKQDYVYQSYSALFKKCQDIFKKII
jgi:hypothetical protein